MDNKKQIKPVATGKSSQQSFISSLKNNIISNDKGSLRDHAINDVLRPGLIKMLHDIGTYMLDVIFYGEGGKTRSRSMTDKVSFRDYSDYYRDTGLTQRSTRPSTLSYDSLVFDTRLDAEAVYEHMVDILDEYHVVSVGDLYELSNVKTRPTDFDYGWKNLAQTQINRTSRGYVLNLPPVRPLR